MKYILTTVGIFLTVFVIAGTTNAAKGQRLPATSSKLPLPFCDGLLQDRLDKINTHMTLPISCSFTVRPGLPPFSVIFTPSGQLAIRQGDDEIIQRFPDVPFLDVSPEGTINVTRNPFFLTDINGDGYKDLQILVNYGAYNEEYAFYLYEPAHHRFALQPTLVATNPDIDTTHHTITSTALGRGIGDLYESETYHVVGSKIYLLRRVQQDFVVRSHEDPYEEDNPLYARTVEERVHGAIHKVCRVTFHLLQNAKTDTSDELPVAKETAADLESCQ